MAGLGGAGPHAGTPKVELIEGQDDTAGRGPGSPRPEGAGASRIGVGLVRCTGACRP
jgi:hypothetical protein